MKATEYSITTRDTMLEQHKVTVINSCDNHTYYIPLYLCSAMIIPSVKSVYVHVIYISSSVPTETLYSFLNSVKCSSSSRLYNLTVQL